MSPTKKNLLFISTYPVPPNLGSLQHAFYFLKALTPQFNVYAVFFVPPHRSAGADDEILKKELGIKEYEICHFNHVMPRNRYLHFSKKVFSFPGAYINSTITPEGRETINRCIDDFAVDIVHFEHFQYTKYAFFIPVKTKKVVVYHDLHHSIFWQQAKHQPKWARKLVSLIDGVKYYHYERRLNRKMDLKVFLNPLEMRHFPKNSVHIPHIINPDIKTHQSQNNGICDILFLGGYNHPPNRVSVRFIVDKLLPRLATSKIKFKIHIVGPDTEKFSTYLNGSNHSDMVTIRGFIPDINDVFDQMDIALFPILYGGGVKTKVLDAMAAGLPVVTTPSGVNGLSDLPSNAIGICHSADEIVMELENLSADKPSRHSRAKLAQSYIESHHSFSAFANKILVTYQTL